MHHGHHDVCHCVSISTAEDFDFDVDGVRKVKKSLKKTLKRNLSNLK